MILSLGTEWFLFLDSLRKTDWEKNINLQLCQCKLWFILRSCRQ